MLWTLAVSLNLIWFQLSKSCGFTGCGKVEYACKDSSCSLTDASYRGGYICDDFPYYAGGFPKFDISIISGQCNNYTSSLCLSWQSIEDNKNIKSLNDVNNKDEINNCKCMEYNNSICQKWLCIENNNVNWDNVYLCDNKYCYNSNDNIEINNCYCNNNNNKYCTQWSCESNENEIGNYKCTSDIPSNGEYCFSWEGSANDDEEFEVTKCECLTSLCNTWYCYKKEMPYWESLFGLSVGLFGTLGFLIPCLFVSKAYCREKCKYRCCGNNNNGYRYGCRRRCNMNNNNNNNQCNMNNKNECLNDNTPINTNNTTVGNDNVVTSNDNNNNNVNQCPMRRRCGYGGPNTHCRYGGCGMCCPKFYCLLLFATITTGGVSALIINVGWWLLTFMLSACLLKRLYCPYRRCNNQRRCGGNDGLNVVPNGEEHSNSSGNSNGSGNITTNYSEMVKTDV